jgi:hypothetical protein
MTAEVYNAPGRLVKGVFADFEAAIAETIRAGNFFH